jgi:trigger factor
MPVVILPEKEDKSEWPFPGFSRFLLGMTAGEEKSFQYTYPEDSDYKELRGKETEVVVKAEEIKIRILPELNDEFAQTVGEKYSDLKALTEDIQKSLASEAKDNYDAEYRDKIMKELQKDASVKYPPQMLEREIDVLLDQLSDRLTQQKLDLDTYLKMRNIDIKALREEMKPDAEERLRRTLILLEISKAENIRVENSELESESRQTLDDLGHMLPPEQAKKTLTNEFVRRMVGNIGADLLVKHTWAYLESVARGEKEEQVPVTPEGMPVQDNPTSETKEKPKKKKTTKKVEKNEPE